MGWGGLDDVSVLSLAGLMRRAGCWCSPSAGAHFEASPGHPRDGGCLHLQTPEQETASGAHAAQPQQDGSWSCRRHLFGVQHWWFPTWK